MNKLHPLYALYKYYTLAFIQDLHRAKVIQDILKNNFKRANLAVLPLNYGGGFVNDYQVDPEEYTVNEVVSRLHSVGWKVNPNKSNLLIRSDTKAGTIILQVLKWYAYRGHVKTYQQQLDETWNKYDINKDTGKPSKKTDDNKKKYIFDKEMQNGRERNNFKPNKITDINWTTFKDAKPTHTEVMPTQEYNYIKYTDKVPILGILELTARDEMHGVHKDDQKVINDTLNKETFNNPNRPLSIDKLWHDR